MTLTSDGDLHRAEAVQLCHALNFSETHFGAIWKPMLLVICAEHHSRIILKYRQQHLTGQTLTGHSHETDGRLYYLCDTLYHCWHRHLSILVQDLKFVPKVTEQLTVRGPQGFHFLFVCIFKYIKLVFSTVCHVHLPTESSGVCYNELYSLRMAELTKTPLIIQWRVSEDHHLQSDSIPPLREVFPLFRCFELHSAEWY